MKLTIDLPQFVIDRIKNNYDYDVPVILNAVDKALSEKASKDDGIIRDCGEENE